MKVIAVDDERPALHVLESAIAEARPDVEVSTFQCAEDALDSAKDTVFSTAFLDVEMRGMSGIDLAKRLKVINPEINIVFVTGYTQYMRDALSMHVSGYVTKPVSVEDIRCEFEELRHPPERLAEMRARVRTFGTFEFLIDEKPVRFKFEKTKELLAYLIDLNGSACPTVGICAVLWPGEAFTLLQRSRFRALVSDLTVALRDKDLEKILIKTQNSLAINPEMVDCDLYRFRQGDASVINSYNGEYMTQYGWAGIGFEPLAAI